MTHETVNPAPNMPNPPADGLNFYGLGIAPKILEALNKMKFTTPTPIQHKAIPSAVEGKDIIGIAQTGTGKTLAFAIPMVQALAQKSGGGLVLVPTRELALQVEETFRKIQHLFGLRSVVLIGGASMNMQIGAIRRNPRIVIATPGRLIDHLERRTISLNDVKVLVLDEADRMLDMGFAPQIERILKAIPKERQTMLFSATMPEEIVKIASSHMKLPLSVEVAPSGTTADKISQEVFIVKRDKKDLLLKKILEQYHGSVLLFSRTRNGARKIARSLRDFGQSAAEIHSERSLSQRRQALDGFKAGKYRILVATDIAARGIDVSGIELVLNYDLPEDIENYVHRIGRTARAGHKGHAISFATPEEGMEVKSIERLIRTSITVSSHPEIPKEDFIPSHGGGRKFKRGQRGFGQQRGKFGNRRDSGPRKFGDRKHARDTGNERTFSSQSKDGRSFDRNKEYSKPKFHDRYSKEFRPSDNFVREGGDRYPKKDFSSNRNRSFEADRGLERSKFNEGGPNTRPERFGSAGRDNRGPRDNYSKERSGFGQKKRHSSFRSYSYEGNESRREGGEKISAHSDRGEFNSHRGPKDIRTKFIFGSDSRDKRPRHGFSRGPKRSFNKPY